MLHPRSLGGQILGRSMLGIAHAIGQKWVYDQHYGVALARRFYQNKPPTILDVPQNMQWDALNIPDPGTPVGVARHRRAAGRRRLQRRVSTRCSDAVGDDVIRRAPVLARHDPDVARSRPPGVRDAHGEHLTRVVFGDE